MKGFLLMVCALLPAGLVHPQFVPYEYYLTQLQACPKECHCPASFPNAAYCDSRGLKHIPTIPSHIWYLYLQNNLIEVVSEDALQNATQLRWLNLNHNKITNQGLQEGALQSLSSLLYLYMEDNLLTEVPMPLPRTLEQLRLAKNRISKIPANVFAGLDHLALLDLQENKLQDDSITEASMKGLTNLVQINLAKNRLTSMPLGLPATTSQLFLDRNAIEKIPPGYFLGLPKVTFLRLNHNKLADRGLPKNIFNLSSILDLQLSHNELTEVPRLPPSLEHLHLNHNNIRSVNGTDICPIPINTQVDYFDEKSPRLRYLRLDGNKIKPPIPADVMVCFRRLRAVVILAAE